MLKDDGRELDSVLRRDTGPLRVKPRMNVLDILADTNCSVQCRIDVVRSERVGTVLVFLDSSGFSVLCVRSEITAVSKKTGKKLLRYVVPFFSD